MSSTPWVGRDERGGVPSQVRPDFSPPPHWRLEAVAATQRPHDLTVSPDGARVAFILSTESSSDVWVAHASGGPVRRLTTDREMASFWEDTPAFWSPSGEHLAYVSGGDLYLIPAVGGPSKKLIAATPAAWLDDDRLVVVVERDRTTRLAVVDVGDPWPRPFGPSGGDVTQVSATGDGRVLATYWPKDDRNRSDVVIADPTGEWATLAGHPDRRSRGGVEDAGTVAYLLEDGDWAAIYLTDTNGSQHRRLVGGEADFANLSFSPDGKRLAGIRSAGGISDLVTIDLSGSVVTIAKGGSWQTPRWTSHGIVAIEESATSAPRLVVVHHDGSQTELLDGAPLPVRQGPHASPERVAYRSLDGLEIEGFLFRPGDTSSPVPAIVYPHGGPTSAYADEWDGHAQYFIDKGYAWFAINFRGSTGYGLEFERANHDDWGVGDTNDCVAAGQYLRTLDWVDGNRVAIFGSSYGSYMALTALVHPNNPFACGVAKYGDCNILTSWAQGDRGGGDDLERMMRHPSLNPAGYQRGSPIHEIERIDKPILIAHGEQDRRVHPKQSEELVSELERLGRSYEYVTYPTEGHGLLRREPQLHFYRRLERFLDWHLM